MKSFTRIDCENAILEFSSIVNKSMHSGKLLYVGIAGDPPGGEYAPHFSNFSITTFDIDIRWKPDIVGDITKTPFNDEEWDVIICVQVIEHIENLFNLPKELNRIIRKNGYLIIDCPWMHPYHAEASFKDYWRISKDGMVKLFAPFFMIDKLISTKYNTSGLFKK